MSVQTQQFRVVGVNTQTGEDVSVVIDAGTKAAAEVKAEKMQIETTHIVRLKQDNPEPPDEHELFSSEAAEALAGKRTVNLIEEVVPQEEPKQAPTEPASAGGSNNAHANPPAQNLVATITRPNYAAPASRQDTHGDQVSGLRAFGLVLLVLMGISAGAYFVLVYQPNATVAQDNELIFGQDLFSDVLEPTTLDPTNDKVRDAFNRRAANGEPAPGGPPIAPDQQLQITPQAEPASAGGSTTKPQTTPAPPAPSKQSKFKLQSVVTTNQGRFAVINGKLYEQGGNIGSAKLVSVADDWVLIERDGKQFTLKIETSASK
jgi:hypothetical protein